MYKILKILVFIIVSCLLVIIVTAVNNLDIQEGLIGEWHFTGSFLDEVSSIIGENNSISNFGTDKEGSPKRMINITDTTGFFNTSVHYNFGTEDFSINMWYYGDNTTPSSGRLWSQNGEVDSGASGAGPLVDVFISSGRARCYMRDDDNGLINTQSQADLNIGEGLKWHMVTCVFNRTGFITACLNSNCSWTGVVNSGDISGSFNYSHEPVGHTYFGRRSPHSEQSASATGIPIDEVAVWNKALTEDEVLYLYDLYPYDDWGIDPAPPARDTLQNVTDRGNTTTQAIHIDTDGDGTSTVGGNLNVSGTLFAGNIGIFDVGLITLLDGFFVINGTNATNGKVGVGVGNPKRPVHIKDILRIEPRSSSPQNNELGDIYVDSDSNELCFYNSTNFVGLVDNGVCQ